MAEISYLLTKDYNITYDDVADKLIVGNEEINTNPKNNQSYTSDEKKAIAIKCSREFYRKKAEKQYENLIILSGAGSSVSIGLGEKKGKTMTQLWSIVKEDETIKLESFCGKIEYNSYADSNLESLLSYAKRAIEFSTKFEDVDITATLNKIEKIIKEECTIALPANSPHEILLNKLAKRKLKYPRAKIFTLNYDTLFEQAASNAGFILIDGFSYSTPRTYNGKLFKIDFVLRENSRINAEENYLTKVAHIYKIHGSIDWTKSGDQIIIKDNPEKPLIIYPNDSKYELSYEQPFFEMMARLQAELRKENVLVICIGFSLNDKHITSVLKEVVSQNPSFELFIVDKNIGDSDNWRWFKGKASLDSRICLIQETFEDFSRNYPEINTTTKEDILEEIYNKPNE